MVSNTNEYAQITPNEDQIKSFVQLDGDNVENKRVVETKILDDNNESSHSEGEVTICDTCGNIGYEDSLVTCCNCKVGAEHTYCMMETVDKIPNNWSCYDCTDEVDGIQKEQKTEETISRKRKAESVTNVFKLTEKRSPQRRSNFLNNEIADFDLNVDLNIELGEMLHLSRQDLQVTSNLSV
ncbi:PREDICTED: uncharacterized protein LOC104720276 [Camelina sativa]|uniref:Uncharacterized protein LOC104720276 n=1 Tax=Camelina sativa TaxID=90675 RepID=A0ABM0U696_CAMSA|nr:PREDICTED: uncharacterized protein LOC104720276 [Camelina sativa]